MVKLCYILQKIILLIIVAGSLFYILEPYAACKSIPSFFPDPVSVPLSTPGTKGAFSFTPSFTYQKAASLLSMELDYYLIDQLEITGVLPFSINSPPLLPGLSLEALYVISCKDKPSMLLGTSGSILIPFSQSQSFDVTLGIGYSRELYRPLFMLTWLVAGTSILQNVTGELLLLSGPFIGKEIITFGLPFQISIDKNGLYGASIIETDVEITSAIYLDLYFTLPFKNFSDEFLVFIALKLG